VCVGKAVFEGLNIGQAWMSNSFLFDNKLLNIIYIILQRVSESLWSTLWQKNRLFRDNLILELLDKGTTISLVCMKDGKCLDDRSCERTFKNR